MPRVGTSIDSHLLEVAKALLHRGESLEQFLDAAIGRAVRARLANNAFLARGLAAGEQARRTGLYVDTAQVLADLEGILRKNTPRS